MGDTLKVTDQSLNQLADQELTSFITDAGTGPITKRLAEFVTAAGSGKGVSGDYTKLMTGVPASFPNAGTLTGDFTKFCTDLQAQIKALETSMRGIRKDLKRAQSVLQNGEDEALSEAQLMSLVSDLFGTGGLTPPQAPPTA
jgi:hypothetical protein